MPAGRRTVRFADTGEFVKHWWCLADDARQNEDAGPLNPCLRGASPSSEIRADYENYSHDLRRVASVDSRLESSWSLVYHTRSTRPHTHLDGFMSADVRSARSSTIVEIHILAMGVHETTELRGTWYRRRQGHADP